MKMGPRRNLMSVCVCVCACVGCISCQHVYSTLVYLCASAFLLCGCVCMCECVQASERAVEIAFQRFSPDKQDMGFWVGRIGR